MPLPTRRFVHDASITPESDPVRYEQGQKQAQIATMHYHYLCAAITGRFDLTQVPGDVSRGQFFSRPAILFDCYTDYDLQPLTGLQLRTREDGTIHPESLKEFVRALRINWRTRAGGVLACVTEQEFWNVLLNYRSMSRTTGSKAWDMLFARLLQCDFDKAIVPCMFYSSVSGCLDPSCPFLHDRDACTRDREKILAKRRIKLGRPADKDLQILRQGSHTAHPQQPPSSATRGIVDDDDEFDVDPGLQQALDNLENVKHTCARPQCVTAKLKGNDGGDIEMIWCTRCKIVTYCSPECQKADWRRHKDDPCRPFEELVEDDDLWDGSGERIGPATPTKI